MTRRSRIANELLEYKLLNDILNFTVFHFIKSSGMAKIFWGKRKENISSSITQPNYNQNCSLLDNTEDKTSI